MGITDQVEFTAEELLMDTPTAAPLIAGGLRCHGGFTDEGRYVSPRTAFRSPAIDAWQLQHCTQFGADIIDPPLDTWPTHFPNLAQATFLLRSGVAEPLIATLTRIGTVEGYGANIRLLKPTNLQRHFVEDIAGTATDHLGSGLFEAHGRDEAGWEEEAGHQDMWFAARDIAFDAPTSEIDIDAMLARMGFGAAVASPAAARRLPDSIDASLEFMVTLMIRVLFIEVSAFHTFKWAEAWLSDPDLVAGEGEAARLVSYIRTDETPHVRYLATALSEMRDRTWVGEDGSQHQGIEMIDALWQPLLAQSVGAGRQQSRQAVLGEVDHWCRQHRNGADLLAEFHELGAAQLSRRRASERCQVSFGYRRDHVPHPARREYRPQHLGHRPLRQRPRRPGPRGCGIQSLLHRILHAARQSDQHRPAARGVGRSSGARRGGPGPPATVGGTGMGAAGWHQA
jgi:hypothetical protein